MAQPTVQAEEYGPLLKTVDAALSLALRAGAPFGRLDPDEMMRVASGQVRLTDFGDRAFEVPLRRLMAVADRSAFTGLARVALRQSTLRALRNRLLVAQWRKAHPAEAQRPLERPIFVLGFPRSGTTLLQNLLGLSDRHRALQFWELTQPVPTDPDPDRDYRWRKRSTDLMLAVAYQVAPEMSSVHEISSVTAEECWPLFFNTFAVLNYDLQSGLPDYGDWLLQQDLAGPYEEYRQQLQVLRARVPDRELVLKCPEHLWFLGDLLKVFPDACIVWTHRDPLDSVASYCSLISIAWRTLYGRFDPEVIGDHILRRFEEGTRRALAVREALGDDPRFIDVDFRALGKDPVGTVQRIHQHFGLPFEPGLEGRIQGWLATERGDHKGAHHYQAERYGLSAERVHPRFREYIDRFRIPLRGR